MSLESVVLFFIIGLFLFVISSSLMRGISVVGFQKFIPVDGEIIVEDRIEYFDGGFVSCLNGECLVGFENGDIAWVKPDNGGILVIADDKKNLDKINIGWVGK